MNTYKLKLLVEDEDEDTFIDFYINVDCISGFYIPDGLENEPTINILFEGHVITVLQETHITNYLYEKFGINAIVNK